MKRGLLIPNYFVLSFLLLLSLTANILFAQRNPKEITSFPELHKVIMPDVQNVTLKNGMRIYLVEDHQYPTIDMRAMVRTGSIYEPAEKLGLASITGIVLRTGGTETKKGDEIDKMLETMGASVETGINQSSGYVYMSILKEDVDKGMDILADILMHPAFVQEKIDLAKVQHRSGISRRNDNIWQITNREFNSLIYGKSNPYARYPEYVTIDNITRDDISAFYSRYFHPNNIVFAIWGDFDTKNMQKKIEERFEKWTSVKTNFTEKPKVDYQFKYTINFIQKSDVNQSHIQMGHIGGYLNDPDYPALVIMNQILSMDRMFKVLRTKEGLTYAPWGYYGAEYDHPGVFNCGTQTKSQTTVYAIKLMLNEVKRITEEPVTDEELQRAKDSYLNSFVFNFDSKSKVVRRLMTYAYFDYPLDFIDRLKESIEKVTKDDILRVAKSHLHPDELQILVVGNKNDFDEPLSTLGNVNEIDITIPSPPAETSPDVTTESLSKGKDFFNKSMEALGGLEALKKIQNAWMKLNITQTTDMGDIDLASEVLIVYPYKVHQSITTPMGEMKVVCIGNKGWMITAQGKMPIQETMLKQLRNNLMRDPVHFFTNQKDQQIQFIGEKSFESKNSIDLLVSCKDGSFHLFLDPQTYLPAGVSYQSINQQGPINVEETWSDYRNIGDIKLPFKTIATSEEKKISEVNILEIKHNVEADSKLFEED